MKSKFSPAAELRSIADVVILRHLTDITKDEKQWAVDAHAELLPKLRAAATTGRTVSSVDFPESDIVPGPFIRGGAAALKGLLERDGFEVQLTTRYAGHPGGEFCFEVRW